MGHRVLACAVAVSAALAGAAHAERVTGKLTITEPDGKPVTADAIVYVVGPVEPADPKDVPKIAQRDRKFVPDLVAVTAGGSVAFPNADSFLHNVFSQSPDRKFDLGSFMKGESKAKDFPKPGVIDVYCNIHPEMAATILVLPNRLYTHVKPDGSFVIDRVPPGRWTVFAYTRRSRPVSAPVVITAGEDTTVNLALARGAEPEHLNKYGEKYHDAGATYR
jgi:plastocyanin